MALKKKNLFFHATYRVQKRRLFGISSYQGSLEGQSHGLDKHIICPPHISVFHWRGLTQEKLEHT